MSARPFRGQTLVLFALTLLLLTLMVLVTLSIGQKVRERTESQTLADAAAYSAAVATARTYNEIAMMNRASVAMMVSMAATQSIISYASYYRGTLNATRSAYMIAMIPYIALLPCCIPVSGCTSFCSCAIQAIKDISDTRSNLSDEDDDIDGDWENADKDAADQSKAIQGAVGALGDESADAVDKLNQTVFEGQKLTRDLIGVAGLDSWVSAPGDGFNVGKDQVNNALHNKNQKNAHMVHATMGTRGDGFVTGRSGGSLPLMMAVRQAADADNDLQFVTDTGNGYFYNDLNHGNEVTGEEAWADDHGSVTVVFLRNQSPCPPSGGFGSIKAHVKSTAEGGGSEHEWTGGEDDDATIHDMAESDSDPKGIWPMFVDYNYERVTDKVDLFGQPIIFATVQRDYAARPMDPWNMMFRFQFSGSGSGGTFDSKDNGGIRLRDGTDISKQTTVGAAMAYYHRMGHWKEPPNLLNPFWRATLVGADLKDRGLIGEQLDNVGDGNAKAVFDELGSDYSAW